MGLVILNANSISLSINNNTIYWTKKEGKQRNIKRSIKLF